MGRPKGSKNKPTGVVNSGVLSPVITPISPVKAIKQNDFYTRHKGPYTLLVHRVKGKKVVSEHLPGRILEGEDVEVEARALLNDPRDTIDSVNVWSEREEQYVTCFRKVSNGEKV